MTTTWNEAAERLADGLHRYGNIDWVETAKQWVEIFNGYLTDISKEIDLATWQQRELPRNPEIYRSFLKFAPGAELYLRQLRDLFER